MLTAPAMWPVSNAARNVDRAGDVAGVELGRLADVDQDAGSVGVRSELTRADFADLAAGVGDEVGGSHGHGTNSCGGDDNISLDANIRNT